MAGTTGLTDGEESVLTLHPHWKTILTPALMLKLIALGTAVVLILIPPGKYAATARIAVLAVALVLAVIWGGIPLLRWRATTYQLTTRRLRLRDGILSRSGRDFPLVRISDVSFSQGLIDRMLGCGQLVVESAGEHGQLVLSEIPQVEDVQARLFQLVEEEQARLAREDR
jgi:uncharacterized membrane protein YdbT with pleckstrin-like domain